MGCGSKDRVLTIYLFDCHLYPFLSIWPEGKEAGPTQREPNFWELHKIDSWGSWYKCLQPFPPRWWTVRFMVAEPQAGSGFHQMHQQGENSERKAMPYQLMDRAKTPKALGKSFLELFWRVTCAAEAGWGSPSLSFLPSFHFSSSVERGEYPLAEKCIHSIQ